jgi:hypothetical protein
MTPYRVQNDSAFGVETAWVVHSHRDQKRQGGDDRSKAKLALQTKASLIVFDCHFRAKAKTRPPYRYSAELCVKGPERCPHPLFLLCFPHPGACNR